MVTEKKFTEADESLTILAAKDIDIRRVKEHVVSIAFTLPDGNRREVQVMSYGEPLSIFLEEETPMSTPDL